MMMFVSDMRFRLRGNRWEEFIGIHDQYPVALPSRLGGKGVVEVAGLMAGAIRPPHKRYRRMIGTKLIDHVPVRRRLAVVAHHHPEGFRRVRLFHARPAAPRLEVVTRQVQYRHAEGVAWGLRAGAGSAGPQARQTNTRKPASRGPKICKIQRQSQAKN